MQAQAEAGGYRKSPWQPFLVSEKKSDIIRYARKVALS
jgi:hypothetical protein